jgi:hypothetical protein
LEQSPIPGRFKLLADEEARKAAEDALPDVMAVVSSHLAGLDGFVFSGDETYAEISVTGMGLYDTAPLEAVLADLGFAHSISSKIGNTRALDGTLTADGDHTSASWTYHPDDGLNIVIERTD